MVAIGIDLGTTKSAVGYKQGTSLVRIVQNKENEDLTPSVVCMRKKKGVDLLLVGKDALDYASKAPADTIFGVKRLMGRRHDEPQIKTVEDHCAYAIERSPNAEDQGVRVVMAGKSYRPDEISAMILKKLKEDAETNLGGQRITHAVITVPAYFEERQREATRQAGVQAGLAVKKIIDEPTAAAIAFGVVGTKNEYRRVLVYDLGGGTFDISILEMLDGEVQGLCIEGDTWLGGDDFDGEIVKMLIEHLKSEHDLPPDACKDRRFLVLAKQAAERAKKDLSAPGKSATEIFIEAALKDAKEEVVDIEWELTRDLFEKRIQPYIDRTMALVRKAMNEQNLKPDDIHQVLMVGGSTLVPAVNRAVATMFGESKLRRDLNPRHVVALGAGLLAASLQGVECPNPKCKRLSEDDQAVQCPHCASPLPRAPVRLTEVTSLALGIKAVRGTDRDFFQVIIPKGTAYPLQEPMKVILYPSADDEDKIVVPVYEGESPIASKNSYQGTVEHLLPTKIDASTPVTVAFNYDKDRVLSVTVSIKSLGFSAETLPKRGGLAPMPSGQTIQPEEDWRENLDTTIRASEEFQERYGTYLEEPARKKLDEEVRKAQAALDSGAESDGKRSSNVLRNTLFGSGVASQLFIAERTAPGAPPKIGQTITEVVNRLRKAHREKKPQDVATLSTALRAAVAAAYANLSQGREVEDVVRDGLLRTKTDKAARKP